MKPTTIPVVCGLSLAAMTAAGLSHWWTVEEMMAQPDAVIAPAQPAAIPVGPLQQQAPVAQPLAQATPLAGESEAARKEFYEKLLAEMNKLRTENRDLVDQMAETNRDLMKLEFRVDTHSESFRPLPVSEERMETSSGDDSGVLPPRAQPVGLPSDE